MKTNIVEVTIDNISEHPQAICFINPKHELYHKKIEWLKEQFKNGYNIISESGKDQLIVKQFKKGSLPSINNWQNALKKYKDLTIVYSKQCPWVARFLEKVKPILKIEELEPVIIELKTAKQAQNGPSLYSAFNLIYDGRLLADRYISTTRFLNIVNKEIRRKS